MSYGIQVDGQNLTYSALSVITKGSLTSATSFSLTKSNYADVTEFKVVFVPIGIRDTSSEEVRPTSSQTSTAITITQPSNGSNHQYLVLGR
jgi:hypothetical protein